MRLRTKFAVVLLVITLLLSGGVFAGLEFYKQQAVSDVQQNVNETAELVAEQIGTSIADRRDFVGFIASQQRARQFDRSERFLSSFLTNTDDYDAAQVIAANGTVVASDSTGPVAFADTGNVSGEPYFEGGRRTTYIGEAQPIDRSPISGRNSSYVLVFSAPIFDADGETLKGVFATIIFLNEEKTVFSPIPALERSDRRVSVTRGNETLNAGEGDFKRAVTSSATVEPTGWTVTVEQDRAALDRRLGQLALFQGLGLLMVLLSAIGFGYWQYSVSLRQTERLLEGFEAISRGEYDHTVSLTGGTEWERIGDGANRLSRTLAQREAALQRRGQRLEVLHRVLRHNVRNEISVVLNYASAIADMAEDAMLVQAGESIVDAGESLKDLSSKARQVETAIQSPDPDREPVDLGPIVREVAAEHRESFPDVRIDVDAPESVTVLAIPSVRIAVENALENACEHNEAAEPEAEVRVDRAGDRVRVAVADNGSGIPEQDRAAIEAGQETDLQHGSGLGLWIVYWVVDNSGGTVSFGADEVDGGLVVLEFEAAAEDGDGAAPVDAAADAPDADGELAEPFRPAAEPTD